MFIFRNAIAGIILTVTTMTVSAVVTGFIVYKNNYPIGLSEAFNSDFTVNPNM